MSKTPQTQVRQVEAVVVSDTHLGTFGCKAHEITSYLNSISTPILILNGDIIDIWQFSKSYFPKSHLKVIRQLIKMMEKGTHIYYITGNHDEHLRQWSGIKLGKLSIENKLSLELDGKKSWIFHGDVFDVFMHRSKWLAKLGASGYGLLTLINCFTNAILSTLRLKRVSLSRDIKKSIKKGRNNTIASTFENTVSELAIKKGYDYAICGHIHWPEKKTMKIENGQVCYLNSGDWVENMTALEYYKGDWHLYHHVIDQPETNEKEKLVADEHIIRDHKSLFKTMVNDIINS